MYRLFVRNKVNLKLFSNENKFVLFFTKQLFGFSRNINVKKRIITNPNSFQEGN